MSWGSRPQLRPQCLILNNSNNPVHYNDSLGRRKQWLEAHPHVVFYGVRIYVYVCMYMYICTRMYMYRYIYVCMYTYICMYVYVTV